MCAAAGGRGPFGGPWQGAQATAYAPAPRRRSGGLGGRRVSRPAWARSARRRAQVFATVRGGSWRRRPARSSPSAFATGRVASVGTPKAATAPSSTVARAAMPDTSPTSICSPYSSRTSCSANATRSQSGRLSAGPSFPPLQPSTSKDVVARSSAKARAAARGQGKATPFFNHPRRSPALAGARCLPRAERDQLVQRAGGEPGQIERHEREALGAAERDDRLAHARFERAGHVVEIDLQPRHLAVVADAQLAEA